MIRNRLRRARERVRGAEHAIFGHVLAWGGGGAFLLEKLKREDLSSLLTPLLPTTWTPQAVIAGIGVAIVVLHFLVGNQAAGRDDKEAGDVVADRN